MDLSVSRSDVLSWLRLALVPGVSLAAQRALLAAFGTPHDVLAASAGAIAAATGSELCAGLIAAGPPEGLLARALAWIEQDDCHLLTLDDVAYPPLLREIAAPPTVLYARGRIELLHGQCLAIVGSRNATPVGVRDAEALARELADSGLTIVSGLALGIDAAAHRGGLAGAASSVAVMGTGCDLFYPKRNAGLARDLARSGCIVSEFPLGTPPEPGNFPRRNRLISGLARGVLVVEAALESGSLITARFALEQNREVFAVPGSIHSPLAKGCHRLVQEGAKLVEEADDVLVELGMKTRAGAQESASRGDAGHDPLLDAIGFAPSTFDEISERSGLDAAKLAALLTRMEIDGRIEALPGGRFQRAAGRVIE